jgi:drug/metabolite transporter (DMT)-like permease
MSRRDLIIFISLSFMWSLSFIFYRVGVPEFGSMSFASLRVIFAGITMLAFVMFNPSLQRYRLFYSLMPLKP